MKDGGDGEGDGDGVVIDNKCMKLHMPPLCTPTKIQTSKNDESL